MVGLRRSAETKPKGTLNQLTTEITSTSEIKFQNRRLKLTVDCCEIRPVTYLFCSTASQCVAVIERNSSRLKHAVSCE